LRYNVILRLFSLFLLKLQVFYFSNNNNARILTTTYAPKVPTAMKMLASALPESNGDAIQGLNTLLAKTNAPRSLKAFGMSESVIDKAADIAVRNVYWNHRVVEGDLIKEIIRRARANLWNRITCAWTNVSKGVYCSDITVSLHLHWFCVGESYDANIDENLLGFLCEDLQYVRRRVPTVNSFGPGYGNAFAPPPHYEPPDTLCLSGEAPGPLKLCSILADMKTSIHKYKEVAF
jgi:hypothetical protein